jgi:hypothetical protein
MKNIKGVGSADLPVPPVPPVTDRLGGDGAVGDVEGWRAGDIEPGHRKIRYWRDPDLPPFRPYAFVLADLAEK